MTRARSSRTSDEKAEVALHDPPVSEPREAADVVCPIDDDGERIQKSDLRHDADARGLGRQLPCDAGRRSDVRCRDDALRRAERRAEDALVHPWAEHDLV